MLKRILLSLATLLLYGTFCTANAEENTTSDSNLIEMKLKYGKVFIELFPEKASKHVARIKELTAEGFYDGLFFHRVIEGFMAQTGDPTGTGTGGSSKGKLEAEFNDLEHKRGMVSMARTTEPNSADSQFFILLADSPHLDGNYTIFGKVISGMKYVDMIKKGEKENGMVEHPDKIETMRIIAKEDMKKDPSKELSSKGEGKYETIMPLEGQKAAGKTS